MSKVSGDKNKCDGPGVGKISIYAQNTCGTSIKADISINVKQDIFF
jgi:hypothetical protein